MTGSTQADAGLLEVETDLRDRRRRSRGMRMDGRLNAVESSPDAVLKSAQDVIAHLTMVGIARACR